jgi:hypothetical protein
VEYKKLYTTVSPSTVDGFKSMICTIAKPPILKDKMDSKALKKRDYSERLFQILSFRIG